jgi:hypothetical protein
MPWPRGGQGLHLLRMVQTPVVMVVLVVSRGLALFCQAQPARWSCTLNSPLGPSRHIVWCRSSGFVFSSSSGKQPSKDRIYAPSQESKSKPPLLNKQTLEATAVRLIQELDICQKPPRCRRKQPPLRIGLSKGTRTRRAERKKTRGRSGMEVRLPGWP